MKNNVIFWDKQAKKYSLKPVPNQEVYEEKLRLTQELMTPQMRVLEIGCGTGTTALLHAPLVKEIIATDFSLEMINIAKTKAKKENKSNITFLQESVEEMSYSENEFDIIMAHSILHLIRNEDEILHKIYSSLKPGGYFITSMGCIGPFFILKPIWHLAFKLGKLPYLNWLTKKEFLHKVTSLGFKIKKEWSPNKVDLFLISKK